MAITCLEPHNGYWAETTHHVYHLLFGTCLPFGLIATNWGLCNSLSAP